MKNKYLLVLLMLLANIIIQAQETCGFEQVQRELERLHPETKQAREKAEAWLLSLDKPEYLKKSGIISKKGRYAGTVYEIPVVVHVIESTDASNAGLSVTDAQIQTWLNNTNKMYATTYGNGYYVEGSGADGGTVIPVKLVLAKRAPNCTSTSGIVRYNGSTLLGSIYDQNGVYRSSNGVTVDQIRAIAPHWSESSYFNMYIVIGFDGNKSTTGLMGFCSYPTNPDSSYDTFMKVTVVTNNNDSTLAHEFGHGMGLDHPFKGANSDGGECPANTGDCTVDDDKVCDTAPTQSLLNTNPTPTNSDINACTGLNYEGVQYNIMNYTRVKRKFTPGQRDRALALFMQYRKSLTQSLAATDITVDTGGGTLKATSCIPQSITNSGNYGAGPTRVQLGSIDNTSSGYRSSSNPVYYIDYSSQNCLVPTLFTKISKETASTIMVSFTTNKQTVKAWIDYNNDGAFDNSELIANSNGNVDFATPFSASFTPPSTAVINVPLRMRVRTDIGSYGVCDNLSYGQIEDYTVTIISDPTLSTSDVLDNDQVKVVYVSSENKLKLIGENNETFGDYQVYSLGGKLIESGRSNNQEIQLQGFLPKGTYILTYNKIKNKKFTNF